MNSVTKKVTWDVAKYKDRVLKVVDAPGVIDTLSQSEKAAGDTLAFVTDALSEAVAINPRGYNAFILIAKYGNKRR
ncbi:unnamed protein product [Lymnaea stagnalis]|uniref:Uncharacterized protein n=1 Tax=Lymnaea stagnalis TaxID=6523 RepID=A0AAV2HN03_LYMST